MYVDQNLVAGRPFGSSISPMRRSSGPVNALHSTALIVVLPPGGDRKMRGQQHGERAGDTAGRWCRNSAIKSRSSNCSPTRM